MSRSEAIEFARQTLRKLGYREEMVYADLEPEVLGPFRDGTNSLPYFRIELGFPASVVAYAPRVSRPCGAARELIPRYLLRWHPSLPGRGTIVRVEVDADSGVLKSLAVDDVLLW